MKRKLLVSLLAIALLLTSLCTLVVGCSKKEKGEYSVTVIGVDQTPVQGIEVKWSAGGKKKASATTDNLGKAVANIELGTYEVTLANYEEGLAYSPAQVNEITRDVTLALKVARVNYVATVKDKTGAPARNVTVIWRKGSATAGTAQTNDDGVASTELDYGNYNVYVSNLPSGNLYEGYKSVTGNSSSVEFQLIDGITFDYTVTVKSEGGLKMAGAYVDVCFDGIMITTGETDDKGVFAFSLSGREYDVLIAYPQKGYSQKDDVTVSPQNPNVTLTLKSQVIDEDPGDIKYVIGDIIHDYGFTTYKFEGSKLVADEEYSIGELLKTKKAIFINNWGTGCTWCVKEMPAMEEAYKKYKDKIEIIAVSNYNGGDSDTAVANFRSKNGLTFPMMSDPHGFAWKFSLTNYPTTVVVDRYGAIARIESGAILEAEVWERLFERYVGDDYVQTFVPGTHESDSITSELAKPDVIVPDDHYDTIASTLNKFEGSDSLSVKWFGETKYEYAWPFIFNDKPIDGVTTGDEKVLFASNGTYVNAKGETVKGKANSMAILYATVKAPAGKVFAFDFYCDTELGNDGLSVVWDGKVVKELTGNSNGWQTCYLYTDIVEGTHSVGITFIKDSSLNVGKDNFYIKDVRFVEFNDFNDNSTDENMLRAMAYGTPEEKDIRYPYYAEMTIGADGYYHVKVNALQGSDYAGNDPAPLVFVNMMYASNFDSQYSLRDLILGVDKTGNYVVNCPDALRSALVEYLSIANASDIHGFLPLDEDLNTKLVQFMKYASGSHSHADEIKEACYFYSHYGSGTATVGNPIIGLTDKTAFELTGEDVGVEQTANLDKNIYPFPYAIYKFTVPADGVYRIESLIPEKDSALHSAQAYLYDNKVHEGTLADVDHPLAFCGDTYMTIDAKNEHNFVLHRYMKAGEVYYVYMSYCMADKGQLKFKITNLGASATVLLQCSDDIYDGIFDKDDNLIGMVLSGAIEVRTETEEENGTTYYHSINPDGTTGDYLYISINQPVSILSNLKLKNVVDQYVKDPAFDETSQTYPNLDYKLFDFRYRVVFYQGDDKIVTRDPKFDLTREGATDTGRVYKDYTDRMKAIIASAGSETDNPYGLVKVTQEIVDILTLFIETRNNTAMNGEVEPVLENEWLRFCWYNRTYNADNQ